MKLARRNLVLAGIWAVLLAATWLGGPSPSERARREVGRLFPDFQREDAARVVLERSGAGAATDATGAERVELLRRDASDGTSAWVLPDHFDHPAGETPLRQLFDALASLTDLDLLSDAPERRDDYGVGEDGLHLRVYDADGALLAGLVQGSLATTGAGMGLASYVRVLGRDEVYRAPRVGRIPSEARRWLETHWVAFDPGSVREFRAREGGADATWERGEMERWTRDGAPVSARLMRSLLDRLAACFLEDVVAATPGDREAALVFEVRTDDGTELRMSFTEPDVEGAREAWLGTDRTVVRFSATTCARLDKAWKALRGG